MTIEGTVATTEHELMLVVERLATQDKRRIVQLVELLSRAPADVRTTNQRALRQLLARESLTHAECQQGIESVLAAIGRELVGRDSGSAGQESLRPAAGRAVSAG
jgi:hypothetical protein